MQSWFCLIKLFDLLIRFGSARSSFACLCLWRSFLTCFMDVFCLFQLSSVFLKEVLAGLGMPSTMRHVLHAKLTPRHMELNLSNAVAEITLGLWFPAFSWLISNLSPTNFKKLGMLRIGAHVVFLFVLEFPCDYFFSCCVAMDWQSIRVFFAFCLCSCSATVSVCFRNCGRWLCCAIDSSKLIKFVVLLFDRLDFRFVSKWALTTFQKLAFWNAELFDQNLIDPQSPFVCSLLLVSFVLLRPWSSVAALFNRKRWQSCHSHVARSFRARALPLHRGEPIARSLRSWCLSDFLAFSTVLFAVRSQRLCAISLRRAFGCAIWHRSLALFPSTPECSSVNSSTSLLSRVLRVLRATTFDFTFLFLIEKSCLKSWAIVFLFSL